MQGKELHVKIMAWFTLGLAIMVLAFSIAVLIYVVHNHQKQTPKEPQNVCTSAANPCIKIAESGGTTFKLNDFRFAPGHCIDFVSLPDNVARHYCGQYNLTWIGPQTAES